MILHVAFIKAVKEALKKKGWSMRRTAREAGLDSSFLSKVLNGKRNPPSDEKVIVRLAQKLDLNSDSLVIYAGRIPAKYQKALEKSGAIRLLSAARAMPEVEVVREKVKMVKKVVKKEMPDELL